MPEERTGHPPAETYSSVGTFAYLLLGPLAWALHLTVVYGAQSTLCTFVAPQPVALRLSLVDVIVIAATVVGAVIPALFLWWGAATKRLLNAPGPETSDAPFHDAIARMLGLLSIIGIMWAGMIVLFLDPCDAMR